MPDLRTDIDTLDEAMRRFFGAMKRQQFWADVVKRSGVAIDRPAAIMLRTLVAHEPTACGVHELAAQLGIEAPSVTRKTQELEEAGYVRRERDPADRRAVRLMVTSAGHKVAKRLGQAQRELIAATLAHWSPEDRAALIELLTRFSRDLADTNEHTKP